MKFVVTAGPTREPIDPVRFLSNRSSGKMGYAMAAAALESDHDVVLISGPVNLAPPVGAKLVNVITSDEMHAAVHEAVRNCDVLVMSAAVSDYKPARIAKMKIKKRDEKFSLDLVPTRDILKSLPHSRNFFVVGFAAETNDLEEHARAKLAVKNCDMMVANDVSDPTIGMESDENAVTIFLRNGEIEKISRASKNIIARALVKKICANAKKVLTKNF
ncbi:MAG TPA: phosphopantothenoylcysteine decarboxylase [Chthoniobacterales bacterium]|nr:phosphopantothenoylcysteine decarboxylase [Chthoniobacterales bacterium]